jgi:hypothetical protein
LKTYNRLVTDARGRGFTRILSLEDDVIFAKDFESRFVKLTESLPSDWKLLYLGASQHSWKAGTDLIYPDAQNGVERGSVFYLPVNTDGAFAIGMHSSSFDYLLKEIQKMDCSFDSGALRSAARNFFGQCFVAYPNLIIADVRESDNTMARKLKRFASAVKWDLDLYDF